MLSLTAYAPCSSVLDSKRVIHILALPLQKHIPPLPLEVMQKPIPWMVRPKNHGENALVAVEG